MQRGAVAERGEWKRVVQYPGREEWQGSFLIHYATHGGKALAAEAAGVTMRTVKRCLTVDPAFEEELDEAYRYHCDLLEWESLRLGRRKANPLPYFDRLKAELPGRHIEKTLSAAVNINVGTGPSNEDAADVLRTMLGVMRPATQALLGGQTPLVIDAPEDNASP